MQADNVPRLLKLLTIRIGMLISGMLPAEDLTPVQCDILGFIFDHQNEEETLNSTRLHTDMRLSRATVSSLLKKLRAAGYLEFVSDSKDERQKHIRLTEKAIRHKENIDRSFEEVKKSLFDGFSESEKSESIRLLKKMLENLDQAMAAQESKNVFQIPKLCDGRERGK